MTDAGHRTALRLHNELQPLWSAPPHRFGFLAAVNHSVIGLRFIVTSLVFFLIGGVLAMLIRAQLAGPNTQFLDAPAYAQVFTMHGSIMMFLFAIPLIEGMAMYLLPKLLGARDLAFPRLGAFGYWCYLFGGSIMILALLGGVAPDSGWFMYTPLSSKPFSPGINADVWLLGITFVEVSAVCAAVEIMVTVLKIRASGMSLGKMPLLVWYLWVTAAMMVAGFPPLILGSILLEVERAFGLPFFDPTRGGDPLLWQHLFWLFGHPEVYIIFLPAAGVVSTILPVFAGRPIVGYTWIVAALIAQAFISFGLWVHHMFTTGIPHLSLAFFSAASLLVVVPTAVQIFAWLATLLKGRPRLELPMLWIFGFFFIFVAGGLTGVMVAVVPFDWQVHDTHFVVAHLHYVLVGGFVFPMLAAIYYWLPQVTGRRSDRGLGKPAFWLIFIGFNMTFWIMHLTGLLGMPRRVYTYAPGLGWEWPNLVSSIGGFVMAIGFAMVVIDLLIQRRFAPHAERNPWEAGTLEWAMAIPVPSYNIASLPHVRSREPVHDDPDLGAKLAAGLGDLAGTRNDWRETLGVDPVTGKPDQVILLPGPTYLPLVTAVATGGFFVSFLFGVYVTAAISAALVLILALVWLWETGLKADPPPVEFRDGEALLPHAAVGKPVGWWGMVFTLVTDGSFFAHLVFGYLFLWVIAPNWPPPEMIRGDVFLPVLTAAALLTGALASRRAVRVNELDRDPDRQRWLLIAAGSGLVAVLGFLAVPLLLAPSATSHAYGAALTALAAYGAFHALLSMLGSGFGLLRATFGYVSAARGQDLRNPDLLWRFTAVTGLILLFLIHVMPVIGMP
jgi:cytochrome c oxidase subunit I+III